MAWSLSSSDVPAQLRAGASWSGAGGRGGWAGARGAGRLSVESRWRQAHLELGLGSHPRAAGAAGCRRDRTAKQGPVRWTAVRKDASTGQLSGLRGAWGSRGEAVGCVGTEGGGGKRRDERVSPGGGAGENAADAPQTP